MNANRVSLVIPSRARSSIGLMSNGGGGWDHPIHLHFEEGITMNRGVRRFLQRKSSCARTSGACAPVVRCNSRSSSASTAAPMSTTATTRVHEDFALLMRIQLLVSGIQGSNPNPPQTLVTDTPNPTEDGIVFTTPEILPEGDPRVPSSVHVRNARLENPKFRRNL